jgi:ribonuclease PH
LLRKDGRDNDSLRDVVLKRGVSKYAEGSCLIQMGDTHVLCTASVEEQVPRWLKDSDQGWVTGEYAMLPRSTSDRTMRESVQGRRQGRGMEIERLIGRSLRAVTNLKALGQRTITVDCDVLQADGGTRCASITGGYVALAEALSFLVRRKRLKVWPLTAQVAALSLGIVSGEMMLDLCYEEDSRAAVDMNLIMTSRGGVVEVQATAEGDPFSVAQLGQMMTVGQKGMKQLLELQAAALEGLQTSPTNPA